MFELNVRANRAATCKFRPADQYSVAVREAVESVKAKRMILLVHGFNTKHEQAESAYRQIATTWSGNLADDVAIGAFSWPSSLAGAGTLGYHAARRRTKEAGRRLAELIAALSEQGVAVSVMGHSLGTVVMGHAVQSLQDQCVAGADLPLWDKAVFQAGDARVKWYRQYRSGRGYFQSFGNAMLSLGIDVRNYYSKGDSVLQLSKLAFNGKRIGRHSLVQPGWSNVDAQALHGGRVRHNTYKKSETILLDALTFLQ